jgi:hypothetical protein
MDTAREKKELVRLGITQIINCSSDDVENFHAADSKFQYTVYPSLPHTHTSFSLFLLASSIYCY